MHQLVEATTYPAKGYGVVVHGLNTHPESFLELIGAMNRAGWHMLSVTLTGHDDDYDAFCNVTAEDWLSDVEAAWSWLADTNKERLPIIGIGYSLGALVQMVAQQKGRLATTPQRWELLAPALFPKTYTHLVKLFSIMPQHWGLMSLSPKGYPAHDKVPFAAYTALYDLQEMFVKAEPPAGPVNIYVDPSDELVSLSQTRKWLNEKQPSSWKLFPWRVKKGDKNNRFHHLIYDSAAMSKEQWEDLKSRLTAETPIPTRNENA